jgi:hypothetical protein
MKTDGSIIIDTQILDGGMEKGFEMIKDEMQSVGITAKKTGEQVALSFSKMDVSKPIANAATKVRDLEQQLSSVTSQFSLAIEDDDDVKAERLAAKRESIYNRLEIAREQLATEIANAARKEAEAEEKESQKAIKAAEKEAERKKKIAEKQFNDITKPARRFNTRLREIISGALMFNLISSGLREMTDYFGDALKANKEFTSSFALLKGALLTAFQPIYEVVLPAIINLMNLLTAMVQIVGNFFSKVTGKSSDQMSKNAKALNKQADAIGGVGDAAEEAEKKLLGFDEINKLESSKASAGGGGGGAGGSGEVLPNFDTMDITEEMERILVLVGAIAAGLLTWKIASMFTDNLKLAAGLGMSVGGALLYAYNYADAFTNGIDWGNFTGMIVGATALVGGLALAFGPVGAAVGLLITGISAGVLALREWINTGELSTHACTTLVAAIMAIGGAITLLVGGWIPLVVAAVASLVVMIIGNWDELKEAWSSTINYLRDIFADGFVAGITTLFTDLGNWISNWFNSIIEWIVAQIDALVGFFSGGSSSSAVGSTPSPSAYSLPRDVPALAKGAVLPANKPFLAMVGDQKHGTNVEAPLDTIKQAVAEVLAGQGGGETAELLRELIATVQGIEVGDEVIGKAAARYSRKTARARGT